MLMCDQGLLLVVNMLVHVVSLVECIGLDGKLATVDVAFTFTPSVIKACHFFLGHEPA